MFERSTRRGVIIGAAIATAMATGGAAIAAIPDNTTGVITGCYDSASGALRVTDTATGSPPACRSTEKQLPWNQRGPIGPTGLRGPQGPAGPNNMHWVKTDAAGNTIGKSDSGAVLYNGIAYTYFTIPNVDPSKCAITVQPANAMFSDGPITTSYQIYGSYVYARAQQLHPNGSVDWYPKTGLDVIVGC